MKLITYTKATNRGLDKRCVEGHCLSTDTKPVTGIANGSILMEMDTGKVFMFDESSLLWKEWG